MVNLSLLKGKIYEKCGSQIEFSKSIGWHKNKVCSVLLGKRTLNANDIQEVSEILQLTPNEKLDIFFNER